MKIITPEPFSLIYSVVPSLPWRSGLKSGPKSGPERGPVLCLGLLAGFHLNENASSPLESLVSDDVLWDVVEKGLHENCVIDEGFPKPCSEYLVYGAACSPTPVSAQKCKVRLADNTKQLQIVGDLPQNLEKHAEPVPFTRMEISWANAFGGPDHEYNPSGKGFASQPDDSRFRHNILSSLSEDLNDPRLAPAGFAAMPVTWPQRRKWLGETDGAWLKNAWPGPPKGTHAEFACVAPEDQRMQGFFRGGESIALYGMHEEKNVMRGVVPRLRGRMFVQQEDSIGGEFLELACNMETLFLFPDYEIGLLLFRGIVPVTDEDCEEIAAVFALAEDAELTPVSTEEYQRCCNDAMFPTKADKPTNMDKPAEADALVEADEPELPKEAESPFKMAESVAQRTATVILLESLEEMKQVFDELLEKSGMTPSEADAFLAEKQAEFSSGQSEDDANDSDVLERITAQIQEDAEKARARYAQTEEDVKQWLDARVAEIQSSPEDFLANLKELVEKEKLPQEMRNQLKEVIANVMVADAAIAGLAALKQESRETEPPGPPPAPDTPLTTDQALQLLNENESLARLNLSKCDFSECDLSNADLRGCLMCGVDWKNVNLSGADLREAIAHESKFTDVLLENAVLDKADFEKVECVNCVARNCSAQKTVFTEACLDGIDFSHASMEGADFCDASLRNANCSGLAGPDLRLQGACLEQAVFHKAEIPFARADSDTNASGADFQHAICNDVNWSGAMLAHARFDYALLNQADISRANLSGASFFMAQARGIVLDKAKLRDAKLVGCDLLGASMRRTDFSKAIFREVNLFGADLYQCIFDVAEFEGVNIGRTLLELDVQEEQNG